jgi:hypothetical protein
MDLPHGSQDMAEQDIGKAAPSVVPAAKLKPIAGEHVLPDCVNLDFSTM